MLKRKKNSPKGSDVPDKKTTVVAGVGSASRYFNVALLLSLVIIAAAAVAILYFQVQRDRELGLVQMQQVGGALAGRIAEREKIRRGLLLGLAKDAAVRGALQSEDVAQIGSQEQRLQQLMPDALRVRLLPKGWDQLEPDAKPPFSYASLDILRNAERSGQATPAEVHLFGKAQQHVALAVPVVAADGGPVVGVLHVAYPFAALRQTLDGMEGLSGRVELQQVVKGAPVVLAAVGPSSAEMSGTLAIAGTIWRVGYVAPAVAWGDGAQIMPLAVLLVAALLIAVVLAFQARHFKQALHSDLESMFGLVEALKSGTVGRINPPKLEEFGHVFGLIRQVWHQASRKPAAEEPAVSKPPADLGMPELEVLDSLEELDTGSYDGSLDSLPDSIFRAYDIRGVVGETLTEQIVYELGRAIGSEAYEKGEQTIIIARDGRHSGTALSNALSEGLMASGRDVLDIGMVPTPVLYFATHFLGSKSGVMITGSHNPPEYNGLKIVINGASLSGDAITGLKRRIERQDFLTGKGALHSQDLLPDYIERVVGDVQLSRPLKLVIDCGNGVAGVVAPALFQALGCEVTTLYCSVDGDFPNHHPDPGKPENLTDLIMAVRERKADLGVAFDGDGDRLGVVDGNGKIIWPDRLLMLLARDVLSRQPGGDVIYDVKSSRHLADEILSCGGRPIMWKTGHSLIKAKMRETGALLAGEMSGHIFIQERWYGFDDGLYSCARLLELLSIEPMSVTQVFDSLPESVSTPELNLTFDKEGANFALMEKLSEQVDFADAKVLYIDGLRVEFEDGWGLVRPSNTTPSVVFRFEADSEAALRRIQQAFQQWLLRVDPGLELPF
ncbi:phosphomannomutase/phosphoglucomutase [Sedimenticola sp.]|uniref:phosphomannomutase/phosphoglucomutase n=1 Tax=Sedimenticola sp. TaxID=1940285 RepID=UPI003D105FBB